MLMFHFDIIGSGQQLRQDDPSALKEIINLVKAKMQGIDATTMNSRTRFMIEALTNLKNNKIKPTADGAIDNYSNLKKFLAGLKKRSGKFIFLSLMIFLLIVLLF